MKLLFGRMACMGHGIMYLRYRGNAEIINMQKARGDMLVRWINGGPRPKADLLVNKMERQDIWGLIKQQEDFAWFSCDKKPEYIVFDSYSDLVEQEFVHKTEGWAWTTVYSDMKHDADFENTYECKGLAPIDVLKDAYDKLFTWIQEKYNVPVYYLHFSTKFEDREKFTSRGAELIKMMDELAVKYSFLRSIHLPDEEVFSGNDGDPYHYTAQTFENFNKRMG